MEDRHVWTRGTAGISEWSAPQWKHTSAGWYSSQVAPEFQTHFILQTQLVFSYSLFSISPLCLIQSLSMCFFSSCLSNPLCKYIFLLCIFLFWLSRFPSLSSCVPKCTSVPQFSRWGNIPWGRHVFVASLEISPPFFSALKKINSSSIFLYLFRVSILQGGGTANSVRLLGGKGGFICIH